MQRWKKLGLRWCLDRSGQSCPDGRGRQQGWQRRTQGDRELTSALRLDRPLQHLRAYGCRRSAEVIALLNQVRSKRRRTALGRSAAFGTRSRVVLPTLPGHDDALGRGMRNATSLSAVNSSSDPVPVNAGVSCVLRTPPIPGQTSAANGVTSHRRQGPSSVQAWARARRPPHSMTMIVNSSMVLSMDCGSTPSHRAACRVDRAPDALVAYLRAFGLRIRHLITHLCFCVAAERGGRRDARQRGQ